MDRDINIILLFSSNKPIIIPFTSDENCSPHFEKGVKGGTFMFLIPKILSCRTPIIYIAEDDHNPLRYPRANLLNTDSELLTVVTAHKPWRYKIPKIITHQTGLSLN